MNGEYFVHGKKGLACNKAGITPVSVSLRGRILSVAGFR